MRTLAVLAAVAAAGALTAAQPRPDAIPFLAIVRGDGILLPIATHRDGAWIAARAFDAAGTGLFRLIEPGAVPRTGWSYTTSDTGISRPLALRGDPLVASAYCNGQQGFASDAPLVSSTVRPTHLMSGIAVNGPAKVTIPQNVASAEDADSRRIRRFIVQLTQALEAERAAAPVVSPRAPRLPAGGRERVAVRVTTLVRGRERDVDAYYFEAVKQYGTIESYANGLISSTRSSMSLARATGGLYQGGETSRRRGRVLGIVHAPLTVAWVIEMRGYEGDGFDIVEMPSGRTLSVHGGGC
jgi:hypothetical protein